MVKESFGFGEKIDTQHWQMGYMIKRGTRSKRDQSRF